MMVRLMFKCLSFGYCLYSKYSVDFNCFLAKFNSIMGNVGVIELWQIAILLWIWDKCGIGTFLNVSATFQIIQN